MRSHGTRDLTFHELARIPATQSGKYDAYAKNMGATPHAPGSSHLDELARPEHGDVASHNSVSKMFRSA